jgi:hypothetical protein
MKFVVVLCFCRNYSAEMYSYNNIYFAFRSEKIHETLRSRLVSWCNVSRHTKGWQYGDAEK